MCVGCHDLECGVVQRLVGGNGLASYRVWWILIK